MQAARLLRRWPVVRPCQTHCALNIFKALGWLHGCVSVGFFPLPGSHIRIPCDQWSLTTNQRASQRTATVMNSHQLPPSLAMVICQLKCWGYWLRNGFAMIREASLVIVVTWFCCLWYSHFFYDVLHSSKYWSFKIIHDIIGVPWPSPRRHQPSW